MTKLPFFRSITLLPFLVFLLPSMSFFVNSKCIPAERTALLHMKKAWGNPTTLKHWTPTSSPCHWLEINCSINCAVTGININNYNITGAVSDSIGGLHNLIHLDFGINNLEGQFPAAVLNCSRLRYLDLSQNRFMGDIPAEIERLKSLQHLDLSGNSFCGSIPREIGSLPELRDLLLGDNLFTSYPVEISNLLNLEIFYLSNNTFKPANLPHEFGKLTKLKVFWMRMANINGEIPDSLGNLSSLTSLDLPINDIQGKIPNSLFLLRNLSIIYLFTNRLSGPIPQVIESLDLVEIDLSMNYLTGPIPEDIGKLEKLELLYLYRNNLSGEVPASIGLLPSLQYFVVFTNNLSGALPDEMGKHSKLIDIEVCDNLFTGKLPDNLCGGGVLDHVYAFGNNFTGNITISLGNCQTLVVAWLFRNSFSGELPSKIFPNLTEFDVSDNEFSGEIPTNVSSWTNLGVFKAGNNKLSGTIPTELASLQMLSTLNLSSNNLSGSISPDFGSLHALESLDLSNNQLSGEIPTQLGNLTLTFLNLSSNQLTGQVPDKLDNVAFNGSFLNNPGLCAKFKISDLPACSAESPKSMNHKVWGNTTAIQHWTLAPSPCHWREINCSAAGAITGININNYYITGAVSDSIGHLHNLNHIDFDNNKLEREFPAAVLKCSMLEYLNLSYNHFNRSAQISPVEIFNLLNLEHLDLSNNTFKQENLPHEFGNLRKLKFFWMRLVNITGEIPESLGNLSSLTSLDLPLNHIEAFFVEKFEIIESLDLVEIDLSMNYLSGPIPKDIGKLKKLELFGALPNELGKHSKLIDIEVCDNLFTRKLPDNLCGGDVSDNEFSGEIPTKVSSWTNLGVFKAGNNKLSGTTPTELASLKMLTTLNLSSNNLSGSISPEFGSLHALHSLDLSNNQLSGEIPPQLGNLTLTFLNLSSNHFTRKVPDKLDNVAFNGSFLNNPVSLNLSSNQLTGKVPDEFDNMAYKDTLLILLLLLSTVPLSVISQSNRSERSALLSLKAQWGDPHGLLQSWNDTSPHCDWPGIQCSAAGGAVAALILNNFNLSGGVPDSMSSLESLTVLDLGFNYFAGKFPTAVLNLSKLEYLDLSQNYFAGAIPAGIGRLESLRYLDLSANSFTGDVPPAIGNLKQLRTLYLYQNFLNGSYPVEISNLENLETLGLAFNRFTPAAIPPEFGRLTKLEVFWMKKANVVGGIPVSFEKLSSLTKLDLSENGMEGPIPAGLFSLKNLSRAYLFYNRFSGSIPPVTGSFGLVEIDLSMNNLTGKIPEHFGKLKSLEVLNLYANNLFGEIPQTIGLLPNLKTFRVFKNNLSGILPPEMGSHSRLESFEVSDNHFAGNLPENLCSGGALIGVVAFSNNLAGKIPEPLSSCQTLRTVQLYGNNLSGEIPSGLWSVLNLTSLMLSDNRFSGKLLSKVAPNLSRVEINNNEFSGEIPSEISSWTSLAVFKASNNMLSGLIPKGLTNLSQLITLMLDGNSLSGVLPSEVTSWKSLTILNLARNNLSGEIPPVFGSLPHLLDLDLSSNHISGNIPPAFEHLKLTSLNLSSNQLTGRIPSEFDNIAYENSFLNNPNLCTTTNKISNLSSCVILKSRVIKKQSHGYLSTILALLLALCSIAIFATCFSVKYFRRKKLSRNKATWKLTSFQRLNFTAGNILSSLAESNMIGSGGSGKVYKIPADRENEYVAVKRIWSEKKKDHFLEKEFLAEIEILGSIRHSNIVKLLCCVSGDDSKLLVYEYMENQSLDIWLHMKRRKAFQARVSKDVLDWPSRLRIAIGAAEGLCYMHHGCDMPIIHRDVKSSNILLDSNFNAKIADFGLAKILAKKGEANTMSAVAGSFGYIAPEYAYTTKVNEKIDVYSFGIVLLEIMTGKEPNIGNEHMGLAEWAWEHYGQGEPIYDALDEEIKEECFAQEMATVFKLGLMCTSSIPSNRPSMKEVLQILQRCRFSEGKAEGDEFDADPLFGDDKYVSSYLCKSKKVSEDSESDESLFTLV
ncbi:leucine-rich repeat receptor-like protein kinase [Striga asiatica]|uniref:non-specific serine/threonine protein kinase n=1 Tax=Striga asiatica TaxID=4170 RepID=A0A5A7PIU1_STRAF|nr:leucine-rich repeat receptor-like protein kinase [Striga asiatica]